MFRSTATGQAWVWLMDGLAQAGGGSPGTLAAAELSLLAAADFDGDGKADLVWRHADGTTYLWTMNGDAVSGYLPVANPGGTWDIVAP